MLVALYVAFSWLKSIRGSFLQIPINCGEGDAEAGGDLALGVAEGGEVPDTAGEDLSVKIVVE